MIAAKEQSMVSGSSSSALRRAVLIAFVFVTGSLTSGCLAAAAVGAAGAVVGTAAEVTIRTTGAVVEETVEVVTPGDDDDEDEDEDR